MNTQKYRRLQEIFYSGLYKRFEKQTNKQIKQYVSKLNLINLIYLSLTSKNFKEFKVIITKAGP